MSQLWLFFQSGFMHVFDWSAHNHILFLSILAVVYSFRQQWKDLLWLLTLFTIGHSIGLLLSLFGILAINSKWIGFLIPIIIFITALYSLLTAGKNPKKGKVNLLLFLCLSYGLIHGLGFGGYFDSISNDTNSQLLAALEYSLGIEMGQIVVTFILLLVSFLCQTLLRFSRRDWVLVTSALAIGFLIPSLVQNWLW